MTNCKHEWVEQVDMNTGIFLRCKKCLVVKSDINEKLESP